MILMCAHRACSTNTAFNMDTEMTWRDLHLLHVHRDTLSCALTRCVACCYKIVLHNCPGLLPNVRPEMCPRMAQASKTAAGTDEPQDVAAPSASKSNVGLYNAENVKSILTVGDGNFSFSLALARALGPDSGVTFVTTSHESKQSVLETYPDGEKILAELNAMPNVTVLHEVDATDAKQMKALGAFDRVLWNFPCVRAPRGEDGQNKEMEANKKLLHDFFAIVAQVLTEAGEVHVTHKTKAPFGQWGIENIATTNKLRHKQSVIFDRCLYHGYSNKKVLDKRSFPIWDSQTFIFVPESRTQPDTAAEGEVDGDDAANAEKDTDAVVPVTMDILKKLYLLLTPSLDDTLYGKKRKRGNKASITNSSSSNNKRKQPASGNTKGGNQSRPGKKKGRRS
ncbi:hypothetical protein BBJ29_002051 [Phytophthora kernoviae]|uniref:25S rRNA (uridine-N(3))-methyltransferase BMT5-like domain-containing protein n=1 Tax=Phytophthora kernoviae TaxID=325452 RepID=A0A3F2RST5_9STRA|nr:hypothetical protein BBJ29_002051 [Phytophthora kernoviae]RLN63578.1 hypothetical protein BBP00_00004031 [Phytophthora kernoviae]